MKVKTVTNTKYTSCDEFGEELQYIYFGNTDDESDDSESFDIDFVIQNFNRQMTVRTDDYQNLSYTNISKNQRRIQNLLKLLTCCSMRKTLTA